MDQKGYIMSGISFLLIIPAIYLIAVFTDVGYIGSQSQSLMIQSDVLISAKTDIENNMHLLAKKTVQETAEDVINKGDPLTDSKLTIKNTLQTKLDDLTDKYKNEGINATCNVLSVNTACDPFKIEINSTISIIKGKVSNKEHISQNISIIDPDYPIPDPLPFIKCKNFGLVTNNSSKIIYGSSLVNFLKSQNSTHSEVYINATSPLIIKKCPYDPYISHNKSSNSINLKNCFENGYYHESNDGACFLCRLEGRAKCYHYGMETFIIPSQSSNETLYSARCSSDHVIFNDSYDGYGLIYGFEGSKYYKIFLDNGHRSKYGLNNISG